MLGDLGYLFIICGFVAALVSGVAYLISIRGSKDIRWLDIARVSYIIQVSFITASVVLLFYLILDHQFQYHYAWKHSSNELPIYYIFGALWEGQEGSFLIWIFFSLWVGLIALRKAGQWESGVMALLNGIHLILISMILGVVISGSQIGSSPFILLRQVLNDPIFLIDPTFVPEDGTGLNPLLQNIWMVIHPPVIFLAFAVASIPFCYCIAGLIKGQNHRWIKHAHIWTIASVGILGLGIMMGAYWAYETLNFGGYWNWDPVENAVLIPWLVLLAAMHSFVLYQKKGKALGSSVLMVCGAFVLIVYSTFLTRSGILGDSSVHSFTDLGLSGQLLIFLFSVLAISVVVIALRRKVLFPKTEKEVNWSFDFWMQLGVIVMALSAFQILLPTSIPVFNTTMENIGIDSNIAPPADPVSFYTNIQLWFAIGFSLVMAIAQTVYFRLTTFKQWEDKLSIPMITTLIISSLVVLVGGITEWRYILILFSLVLGLSVTVQFLVIQYKMRIPTGGALSHVGFLLMVLGFFFSSAFSDTISENLITNVQNQNGKAHEVREHLLLNRDQTKESGDFEFTYLGKEVELSNGGYVNEDILLPTNYPNYRVLTTDISSNGLKRAGDTVQVNEKNTFYRIKVQEGDQSFVLAPRMQNNPDMGYMASPDITHGLSRDVYLHVSNFPDPTKQTWSKPTHFNLNQRQDVFFYKNLEVRWLSTDPIDNIPGVILEEDDLALQFQFRLNDGPNQYLASPVMWISEGRMKLLPDENKPLGIKLWVDKLNPETGAMTTSIMSSQRDWITIKAEEKPLINLVWMGVIIMVLGTVSSVANKLRKSSIEIDSVMQISYVRKSRFPFGESVKQLYQERFKNSS